MGAFRFRPHEKLRSSAEYQRVKQTGKRFRTPHFGVNTAVNELRHHRLGMIVQKRYWCAVHRNGIKRRLREWFRTNKDRIPLPGKDIVIIARPGAEKLSPDDISREFASLYTGQDGRRK